MGKLSKRDIQRAYHRWWYANEIPNNHDYLLGPSLLFALLPILRKLYPEESDRILAYRRHLSYFNTQAIWGGATITGIVANLEEKLSDEDETINESVISITKTGLMGVLAGVGDTVDSGTVQYIFILCALPWAFDGHWIGALYPWIGFVLTTYSYGTFFAQLGYMKGRLAALDLVSGTWSKRITEITSSFGLILLGYIGANYANIPVSQFLEGYGQVLLEGGIVLALILADYKFLSIKGLDLLKGFGFITILVSVLMILGIL